MKGLLVKDFYVLMTQIKVLAMLFLLYIVLGIMNGNAAAFSGVIILMCAMLPITTISYDERANWDAYALTMPVSRTQLVLSKYLFGFLLAGAGSILCFILHLILTRESWLEGLLTTLAILGIGLLYQAVILPVLFRFGSEKSRIIMIMVVVIPVAALLAASRFLTTLSFPQWLLSLAYILGPVLLILLLGLSVLLSIRIIKRKQF